MFDLARVEWRSTRREGIQIHFLNHEPDSSDVTVLIKMEPGSAYPGHTHTGDEEVLVLQGGYSDEFGEHRAGEFLVNPAGTSHRPVALDAGEDCIIFAIAHGGVTLEES